MNFHFNAFSIALLMSGVAALLMSLVIFQRNTNAVKWFAFMEFCSSIWAICYAFELSSDTLRQMLFWIDLEYVGISLIPATWIIFIFKFIGKEAWLTLRNRVLIFSFPVLALLLVWTNPWHHIHYANASLDTSGPFPLLAITPGPWYHVHTVYFYFLLVWGMSLLFRNSRKADEVYKRQNYSLLIGASIPCLVNVIYLFGLRPFKHIDLTPFAFILTSIVIGFSLLRYKLFDVIPLAREKVIERVREGILVLDARGRVIDQNETMKEFLRPYSSSVVGMHLDEVMPVEYKLHLMISKRSISNMDIMLKGGTGDRFFEVTTTPLFERETVFSGTLLIFWDITERKRSEEQLKAQASELTVLNQVKDRMFSIISHDIRGPIASLKGILTLAEEGDLTAEEFKSYVPLLSKNVGYTSELLDNILQWSKSQLQGETIRPEHFDLKSITQEKIMLFGENSLEKKIVLEDRVPKGTFLLADKNMVGMVLQNLIANAIKFCKAGDKVSLGTEVRETSTIVSVRDTGMGMASEVLNRLFGLGTFTTRGTQGEIGTGLGLKLCKDFIEKNGGRIWAESTTGEGSCFYFELKNGVSSEP